MTDNFVFQPAGFRLRVIGRIRTLKMLDGVAVNEAEATAALRLAAGSRISQVVCYSI